MSNKKKLIEVAMPLDAINAASVREKSIRYGHPSTLHLWWARRPLASARAVIWASLVDDPSSHPELFPTEKEQSKERKRLFGILEQLVKWENSNDQDVLEEAKREIRKSTDGNPPEFLDPFAGGGALPLEAFRLGLKAHAHDLNPVSVLINKSMIEYPCRFYGNDPVNPSLKTEFKETWTGYSGLAEDIKYYGKKLRDLAYEKLRNLYPKASYVENQEIKQFDVISWLWARTVKCPNPACNSIVPLISSTWISKVKGKESWVGIDYEGYNPKFTINSKGNPPIENTISRKGGYCPHCGSFIDLPYIRQYGKTNGLSEVMFAEVLEGDKKRIYQTPEIRQIEASKVNRDSEIFSYNLPADKKACCSQNYGISTYNSLFSDRQLEMLKTFSDLIMSLGEIIKSDAVRSGMVDDEIALEDDGEGATAYAQIIQTYLTFVLDKLSDYNSSACSWNASGQKMRNVFGRQAIPMVWDYAEANPFSHSSGSFDNMLEWVIRAVLNFPRGKEGEVSQHPAQDDCKLRNVIISTDPPYYDNIGYSDLSDFFYGWMRRTLKNVFPDLLRTVLTPKSDELIACFHRHPSKEEAKEYFETEMKQACKQLHRETSEEFPVTIYYAYKQSDSDNNGTVSSGWETMLSAVVGSGFTITGTWPLRTEKQGRIVGNGTNALASSVVLVCRKRDKASKICTRRNFINELRKELHTALRNLQESNLAPVDMAQSAIGPGIAVFSKYSSVLEADGTPMSIRTALQLINKEIDNFFNEQDSDLDEITRFCIDLYKSYGFNEMKYGDADILGKAKNISVEKVKDAGSVKADKGYVSLTPRNELKLTPQNENIWNLCQVLVESMDAGGEEAAAEIVASHSQSKISAARELVYRLFSTADKKGWNSEAYKYNTLINAWPSIDEQSRKKRIYEGQMTLKFES